MKNWILALISITLFVSCEKEPGPATPLDLTPDPTEKNEPPYDILLSNQVIEEMLPAGTIVGELTGLDPNNDTLEYRLSGGPGSADNDLFELDSIYIRTKQEFTFGSNNSYSIRIWATDGEFGFYKNFELTVMPYIPKPPLFYSPMINPADSMF